MQLLSWTRSAAALALLVAGTACSSGNGFDPMDPALQNARLVVTSEPAVTLGPSASTTVALRYEREDGSVIANAPIAFELVGTTADSMLAAREGTTDAAGAVSMAVNAGTSSASFRVVATGPLGETAEVEIVVTTTPAGNLTVRMRYSGMSTLDRFEPFLYRGVSCTGLDPMRLPTADRAATAVTRIDAMPSFAGLTPASNYTVVVRATSGGMLRGIGCVDAVTVENAATASVIVIIRDAGEMQPRFDGVYDLDNRLDLGGTLPPSIATALDVLDELTDDTNIRGSFATDDWGQDPGAFVVDMAMRQTCAWECTSGESYSVCADADRNHTLGDLESVYTPGFLTSDVTESRFTGGCAGWDFELTAGVPLYEEAQTLVNEQITAFVPDVVLKIATIAGDLARAFTNANIHSVLSIDGVSGQRPAVVHELVEWKVPLHDLDGVETTYTINLRDAGLTALRRDVTATVDGTTLTIPDHTFALDMGRLLVYVYRSAVLPLLGVTTTAELLATWIDCGALATRLHGISDFVSVADYERYCAAGLTLGGSAIESGLESAIGSIGNLTLRGTTTGAEFDMTMHPRRLVDGLWEGGLAETIMTIDVTGNFTGVRR